MKDFKCYENFISLSRSEEVITRDVGGIVVNMQWRVEDALAGVHAVKQKFAFPINDLFPRDAKI